MRPIEKMLRTSAAVLLAGAVVAGGVELGSPGAPPAIAAEMPARYYAEGEMPEYPGSLEFPLGDGLAVNGVPLRISYFETGDRPDAIRDYYVRELDSLGLDPNVQPGADDGWTVSALGADGRNQIVVAIMAGGNRTFVFPSMVPTDATPAAEPLQQNELPFSPSAVGIMRVSAAEGGRVVTYREPALQLGPAAMRIRDEMGRRGWELAEFTMQAPGTRSAIVEVKRGARRAHFTVTPHPDNAGSIVVAQYSVEE